MATAHLPNMSLTDRDQRNPKSGYETHRDATRGRGQPNKGFRVCQDLAAHISKILTQMFIVCTISST